MKNMLLICLMAIFSLLLESVNAQQSGQHPTLVRTAVYSDAIPSLLDLPIIPPQTSQNQPSEGEVENEMNLHELRGLHANHTDLQLDPVLQEPVKDNTAVAPLAPIQNFDGIYNTWNVYPPDTQGDVGPNHYVQVVNLGFQIWNKSGVSLYGPANLSTIWTGIPAPWNGTNNGDPIVLYDQAANRWMIAQFSLPNSTQYAMLIAVSQTSDPTGAWYRYVYQFGNKMPDYPHFGVWPDGYYMAVNQFISGSSWGGVGACAFDRAKMLAGDPGAAMIYFDLGASSDPGSMLPSDWDGAITPLSNEPNYFTYFNDWSSPTEDYLKIWQFHADWTTPSNSTFTQAYSLVTAPFNSTVCASGNCVPQLGTTVKLETLTDRLMYRLQYRNFGGYQAMVTNHTVNADGAGKAGIRWYELRNTGSGWSIYQQGTYAPDASNRWMGSIAMNASGDIALGYSVSSASMYPAIRYTGRLNSDPLGTMGIAEQSIIAGSGYQSGSAARWGDYSMMSVDPADDLTFWYTTEYYQTSSSVNWRTRIASMQLAPPNIAPIPQFNAGTVKPCINTPVILYDQSAGLPTSWSWSVTPSGYTFVDGTTSTSQNPHISFTAYGNYTVTLTATNSFGTNSVTKTNFISVNVANPDFVASNTSVVVDNPVTFTDASTCAVTSWLWDFGVDAIPPTANTQGPHTVTYNSTGPKTITLTLNGTIIQTKTNYINVTPVTYCTPAYTNGTGAGDYITLVKLGSINNATGASANPFYTYYSDQWTDLEKGSTYVLTVSPGTYATGNNISAWIDFNRNGSFETTEKLGNVTVPPTPATGALSFTVPLTAVSGPVRMRVREVWNNTTFDACSSYGYGETEDYNVNLISPLPYCQPSYITGTVEGDYISLVQMGSINNATGASASPFYSYFSDQITDLAQGSTYSLTVSAGTYSSGNNISAWIDYDRNGVFDASEKLGNVTLPAAPTTGVITFTVPGFVGSGMARMRVREVYGYTDFDACSGYYYGETEDYNVNLVSTNKNLNLTVLLQGLYNGSTMNKAQNASGDQFPGMIADQITLELHNSAAPYSLAAGPYTVGVNTSGIANITIPAAMSSSYYIVVKNRNSLETWSANPVSFSGSMASYNFSSGTGQAYGNNLVRVGSKTLLYGGDVNQDGIVDSGDMIPVENLSTSFSMGYLPEDANGDGLIDSGDMIIIDNNSSNFVSKITP